MMQTSQELGNFLGRVGVRIQSVGEVVSKIGDAIEHMNEHATKKDLH